MKKRYLLPFVLMLVSCAQPTQEVRSFLVWQYAQPTALHLKYTYTNGVFTSLDTLRGDSATLSKIPLIYEYNLKWNTTSFAGPLMPPGARLFPSPDAKHLLALHLGSGDGNKIFMYEGTEEKREKKEIVSYCNGMLKTGESSFETGNAICWYDDENFLYEDFTHRWSARNVKLTSVEIKKANIKTGQIETIARIDSVRPAMVPSVLYKSGTGAVILIMDENRYYHIDLLHKKASFVYAEYFDPSQKLGHGFELKYIKAKDVSIRYNGEEIGQIDEYRYIRVRTSQGYIAIQTDDKIRVWNTLSEEWTNHAVQPQISVLMGWL